MADIKSRKREPKIMIGWSEWCCLPALELPAIKAKVDTGAKTSALHAFDITTFVRDGEKYVRFKVHPLQQDSKTVAECEAPFFEKRSVTSSNGEREKRFVIKTPIKIGDREIEAELTLTSRYKMAFRMLLGREALRKGRLTVDPAKNMILGKKKNPTAVYEELQQSKSREEKETGA